MDEYQDLLEKYKKRIKDEFGENVVPDRTSKVTSKEYTEFKSELYPSHYSFYEKACNFSGNLLKVTPDAKRAVKMQESIDTTHLSIGRAERIY